MFDIALYFVPFTAYPYRGVERPCPICGCAGHTPVANLDRRLKRLPTVLCDNCGLLHTNPAPSDEEIRAYYQTYYRFDYQMTARPTARHVRKRNAEAARRIGHLGSMLKPAMRTLDFGAGSGEFVEHLAALGHDANGFEPGENYARYAQERLGERIRLSGYEDTPFDGSFDLVTCFHVLEHLRDPIHALSAIEQWLCSDGKAYIEVPNMGADSTNKGFGNFHFAHLLGFNHYNLRLAAHHAGLKESRSVKPTGIIFEKGQDADPKELAAMGLAAGRERFLTTSPARSYLSYHFDKTVNRLSLGKAK